MKKLENIAKQIYRGKIWKLAERLNIDGPILDFYWHLKLKSISKEKKVDILEYTAEYNIHDRQDYSQIDGLLGEETIIKDILQNINENDIVYDIGANIGLYTCFLAQKAKSGKVLAFEPVPSNAKKLKSNLARNVSNDMWDVHEISLSDANKSGTMSNRGTGDHTQYSLTTSSSGLVIEERKASDLIREKDIDTPDILKVDVEGSEYKVLQGFEEYLDDIRLIYCELHPNRLSNYGNSRNDVIDLLRKKGFEVTTLKSRGQTEFIQAESG